MESQPNPAAAQADLPPATVPELMEALALPGLGAITVRRLLRHFGSWAKARATSAAELRELGLKSSAVRAIQHGRPDGDLAEELERARAAGVRIVACSDPEFPPGLRHDDHQPLLLYVKGELKEADRLAVGIVGSRRASLYGKTHAERLAFDLAQAGVTVISGLAQGVDTAAHNGALKGGGRTLAVLGNGLGSVYPPENAALAERVARSGALLSELPMQAPPAAANFPPRNRIIAGLAVGVLVVEASRTSGALITARMAGEMGRDVFALPGDIGRPQTRGTNQLIRDGATLVESVEDILEALGPLTAPLTVRDGEAPLTDPRALLLNQHERLLFDLLDSTPKDIDLLTRESRLSAANAASILMVLELKHLAAQLPGQRYVRAGTLLR